MMPYQWLWRLLNNFASIDYTIHQSIFNFCKRDEATLGQNDRHIRDAGCYLICAGRVFESVMER